MLLYQIKRKYLLTASRPSISSSLSVKTHTKKNMKLIENILTTFAVCLPLAFVGIVLLSLPR